MKPVLGKRLKGRKVVSNSGLELGHVMDATFETDGKIINLVVQPVHETKEIQEYINSNHLMDIPYESVKAIGRYVVVEFPFAQF